MTSQNAGVEVEVVTERHIYTGRLPSNGRRTAEVLNDQLSGVIELWDVIVESNGVSDPPTRHSQLLVRKANVLFVALNGKHEAPGRRLDNFVFKPEYPAVIILPSHVLCGLIPLSSRTNPSLLLDANSPIPQFIGMTQVEVRRQSHAGAAEQHAAVLLNRPAIEAVRLAAQPLAKPQPAAAL